jgi:hypothetical protein
MTATPETQTPEPRCVRCGQAGHLSKDCPWPLAARAPARVFLPLDVARCQPLANRCKQAADCARATDWPETNDGALRISVIDASTALRDGAMCAMFIDGRGLALRGAA